MDLDVIADVAAAAVPLDDPSKQRLSTEERWTCIVLKKQGKGFNEICHDVKCSRQAVANLWNRYVATGAVGSGSHTGRKRKSTKEQDEAIVEEAKAQPFTSPKRIRRKLEFDHISITTIDRRLQEAGLYGRVARHKRAYTPEEIRKRLAFAEGYKDWTLKEWSRVIFADEKSFYGRGWCGRCWVRRPKGEALNPKYTAHQVAHPALVGMWGCFSVKGPGYIRTYNGTIDRFAMKDILAENLLKTAEDHQLLEEGALQWYFLHDNAPTFSNDVVRTWLHNKGITCVEFPPYSPDLNPIENLWSWFSRRLDVKDCDKSIKLLSLSDVK